MKRKALLIGAVMLIALGASPAFGESGFGSFFGCLTTAKPIGMGHGSFQGSVGIADLTSFAGGFRYGFSDYTQGRIQIGMADADGADASLIIGADFLYQFWNVDPKAEENSHPFDMGFQGIFEYGDFDYVSALLFGGGLVGSYPFVMKNGSTLTPYARVNIRLEKLSYDYDIPGIDDNSIEFGLNGGVHYQFTQSLGGYAEFQVGGNDGLLLGIELLAM